jgi:uncharacterized protein (DUF2147 family)
MRICKFFLTCLLPLVCAAGAGEQSAAGLWKTIDDSTHKPRALVRIFEREGEFFGRVEAGLEPSEAAEICAKCDGERRGKPVVGMVIMRHMKKHGQEYSGGDIVDPESGWVYRCRMTLEDGGKKLVVRGFLGISLLGRSQVWFREE